MSDREVLRRLAEAADALFGARTQADEENAWGRLHDALDAARAALSAPDAGAAMRELAVHACRALATELYQRAAEADAAAADAGDRDELEAWAEGADMAGDRVRALPLAGERGKP